MKRALRNTATVFRREKQKTRLKEQFFETSIIN